MLGRSALAGSPFASGTSTQFNVPAFAPSQAKVPGDSLLLSQDQQTSAHVYVWDTPFTVLEGDVASEGLRIDVREPLPKADWRAYTAAIAAAGAGGVAAAFAEGSRSTPLVTDGRVPNLIESWSGGAPAWYGATQRRRVAMHWRCVMRPIVGRSWFSSALKPTFSLAIGGNGYVRITKTVSGVTSEVLIGGSAGKQITEADYLSDGLTFTDVLSSLGPGDALDIYYVQNNESWGGLVIKTLVGGTQSESDARDAAVLGCGLFDSGTQPVKRTLPTWSTIRVNHARGAASNATAQLPLINPRVHDGFGYEIRRTTDGDDPGILMCWDGGTEQFTLRRGELVRITGGLKGEEYVLFTGFIDDFEASGDGLVNVRFLGFEQRGLKDMIRNEPDEISYMAASYRKRTGATEPVYGIAAYDNWSIEQACKDILFRVGVDGSRFTAALMATTYDGDSAPVVYNGETYRKFRARGLLGNRLRLERSVRYGNVGFAFEDGKPADDKYVFSPENSAEPWSRVREIADRYGYDIRFDAQGDCVLATRGNASTIVDVTTAITGGGGTQKVHPSAFRGTYFEWTGTQNPNVAFSFTGSRIDVSLPRGPGFGNWAYMRVVRASDNFEVQRIKNLNGASPSPIYFYDYATTTDGTNATVATLFSGPHDTYNVECVGSLVGPDGKTRRLDCFFVFAIDPLTPLYPRPLSTSENALSVHAGSAADEMRNLVYVIGQRKAAVQDSAKLNENPNNPEPEFIVEVAVDTDSITNPLAKNYVGGKRQAAIFQDNINDPDFAAYLARTLVYRYRMPRPPATVEHTILPVLELRDPLFAEEAEFGTVDARYVVWTTSFTHEFDDDGAARTTIETDSWPEFPSYELREDIDIDAPNTFFGVPVANVEVGYTSLTGQQLVNVSARNVVRTSGPGDVVETSVAVTPGSHPFLDMTGKPWPPIPGTLFLGPPGAGTSTPAVSGPTPNFADPHGGLSSGDLRPAFTMSPGGALPALLVMNARSVDEVTITSYRKTGTVYNADRQFTVPQDRSASSEFYYEWNEQTKKLVVFWKADGTKPTGTLYFSVTINYTTVSGSVRGGYFADNPYHHFTNIDYRDSNRAIHLPWKQGDGSSAFQRPLAITSYSVKYRALRGDVTTFSDPYSGVSPFADPTTSELGYLAAFTFDALVTGFYRATVRSLHDDSIVAYLTEPTADAQDDEAHWAYITAGPARSFNWDFTDQLGAWNKRQSLDYSAALQGLFELNEKEPIGAGWYVWNQERTHDGDLGELALIAGDRETTGKPVFGHGTYAAWYLHIEVKNDHLEEVAAADPTKDFPRVARTREPQGSRERAPIYTTDNTTSAVVYTHLPEPTMAEISVADWVGGAYSAGAALVDANWGAADSDATISNDKPVRVQFSLKQRPGALWVNHRGDQEVKLTRHVHLRDIVHDQFEVSNGASYPNTTVEQRTVYSRRLTNDEHTLTFVDAGWRKAKNFRTPEFPNGTVQWVFRPSDIKKKFRDIDNESLAFGDYLQLHELPQWDAHRPVAGATARYILGFMAYLFYLSAFVQDRSGRRMWCTNRRFLDKSKITSNAYTDWWDPASPTTPASSTTYRADWPADPLTQQRRTMVCRQWTNEGTWVSDQIAKWNLAGTVGEKLLRHKWKDHEISSSTLNGSSWPTLDLDEHSKWHADGRSDLPSGYSNLRRQLGTYQVAPSTRLGKWTFEGDPLWITCVTRDFHPYYQLPPMPDPKPSPSPSNGGNNLYAIVQNSRYDSDSNTGDDAAASTVWNSWARDMTQVYGQSSAALKHFNVGTRVNTTESPNKAPLAANAFDYVRQDDMVHFEDLRGTYTRGQRPSEQPKKITPVAPYYLNLYRYGNISSAPAVPNNQLGAQGTAADAPKFYTAVAQWFRMSFRSEYVVESAAYFPTDRVGRELLSGMNAARTRYTQPASVFYDAGAWTGWKDDTAGGSAVGDGSNIFEAEAMPFQIGPELPETKDIYMHMVLVNERRASPV